MAPPQECALRVNRFPQEILKVIKQLPRERLRERINDIPYGANGGNL